MLSRLRHFPHLAEHLAAGGLVEADVRIDDADGIQHARDAQRGDFAGEDGLAPGGGHEGLRRQIVDFVGAMFFQQVDEAGQVDQVALDDLDPILDVLDAAEVAGAAAAHDADDVVAFFEQKIGQIRAILAGDSGD